MTTVPRHITSFTLTIFYDIYFDILLNAHHQSANTAESPALVLPTDSTVFMIRVIAQRVYLQVYRTVFCCFPCGHITLKPLTCHGESVSGVWVDLNVKAHIGKNQGFGAGTWVRGCGCQDSLKQTAANVRALSFPPSDAMLCCAMLCYAVLCYAMLCYTVLGYTILYYTILYYTILYYDILHYNMRYTGSAPRLLARPPAPGRPAAPGGRPRHSCSWPRTMTTRRRCERRRLARQHLLCSLFRGSATHSSHPSISHPRIHQCIQPLVCPSVCPSINPAVHLRLFSFASLSFSLSLRIMNSI